MSSMSGYLTTIVIDGIPTGAWDTLDGGATTSEVTKRRPGGTIKQKITTGRPVHDDQTFTRENERERDWELLKSLRKRVGKATVVITKQPLDEDQLPWGTPETSVGILTSLDPGGYDSDSDAPQMASLVANISEIS